MNEMIPLGQVRIANLLIMETGTYNPQFRRPYETHMEADTLQSVVERVAGAPKYNPMLLAGVASQFVLPQATPEAQLNIANGWDTKRGAFMMEVHHQHHPMGTTTVLFVQGYTDHFGVHIPTPSNVMLDDRMIFTINNITKVRSFQERVPGVGLVDRTSVVENAHLLVNPEFSGVRTQQKDHRMRPEDVYSAMSVLTAASHLDPNSTTDMRVTMTDAPTKSRRKNALPASYMASVLDGMREAVQLESVGAGYGDLYTSARGAVAEESVARDSFLKILADNRGGHYTNNFTWRELKALDANVDNVTGVNQLGELHKHEVHSVGQTAYWQGSDRETQAAAILAQAIPALMMELTLTQVGFKASNHTLTGTLETRPFHFRGFLNGVDSSPYMQAFLTQVESIILRDVIGVAQCAFQVHVNADVRGETWIQVQFDSNPPVDYVVPSFCDALMAPVLTMDRQRVATIANDFQSLIGVVNDANQSMKIGNMPGGSNAIFGNI